MATKTFTEQQQDIHKAEQEMNNALRELSRFESSIRGDGTFEENKKLRELENAYREAKGYWRGLVESFIGEKLS